MARHGVLYLLSYKSDKLDMVNTKFQHVRLTININTTLASITWKYSYLRSEYTSYRYCKNIASFVNGSMLIFIYNNFAIYIVKRSLTVNISDIVTITGKPLNSNQYGEISKHFNELLPMNFADPIGCYWKIVNFAKKYRLAI